MNLSPSMLSTLPRSIALLSMLFATLQTTAAQSISGSITDEYFTLRRLVFSDDIDPYQQLQAEALYFDYLEKRAILACKQTISYHFYMPDEYPFPNQLMSPRENAQYYARRLYDTFGKTEAHYDQILREYINERQILSLHNKNMHSIDSSYVSETGELVDYFSEKLRILGQWIRNGDIDKILAPNLDINLTYASDPETNYIYLYFNEFFYNELSYHRYLAMNFESLLSDDFDIMLRHDILRDAVDLFAYHKDDSYEKFDKVHNVLRENWRAIEDKKLNKEKIIEQQMVQILEDDLEELIDKIERGSLEVPRFTNEKYATIPITKQNYFTIFTTKKSPVDLLPWLKFMKGKTWKQDVGYYSVQTATATTQKRAKTWATRKAQTAMRTRYKVRDFEKAKYYPYTFKSKGEFLSYVIVEYIIDDKTEE